LLAATFAAGFGAGLAGLFFRALRAEAGGAALARAGMDGFDFAATFLALEAALAMTDKQSARGGEGCAPYTTLNGSAQDANVVSTLHVKPFEQTEANQAGANQINRDHEIKQPRHDQDQDARDQGHYGRNVSSGDGHRNVSEMRRAGNRLEAVILSRCPVPR
jgi:hypothetical protein